jgi:hypothetical protein
VTLEQVAAACHEINRAYSEALGERKPRWETLTDEQRDGVKDGVLYVLANPAAGPQDAHVHWCRWMLEHAKVAVAPNQTHLVHPNLVEWEQLPAAQRAKDELFVAAARGLGKFANQITR